MKRPSYSPCLLAGSVWAVTVVVFCLWQNNPTLGMVAAGIIMAISNVGWAIEQHGGVHFHQASDPNIQPGPELIAFVRDEVRREVLNFQRNDPFRNRR